MKYSCVTIFKSDILDECPLSLTQIAKRTGLHPSYISLLKHGKRVASQETFQKILDGLSKEGFD